MDRLSEITFRLPDTAESRGFLDGLRLLLADVPYAATDAADRLTLTPPWSGDARPVTTFALADVPAPEVALDDEQVIGLVTGPGTEVVVLPARVELPDLVERLAGHVRRVDHTG
ncbi:hypothetical protein ACFQZ4_34880 [Catellatospora coxensis]